MVEIARVKAFVQRLGIRLPIIQAPMAGIATPELAAAVSNAGGLGSLGVGNLSAGAARQMIAATAVLTSRPFNVNVFCHQPAVPDAVREEAWLAHLRPQFGRFGAEPPARLREPYRSFLVDDEMFQVLLDARPAVVSFHFGLASAQRIAALKQRGIALFATATNLHEACAIYAAGIDAVIAQGYEAGGHRGAFDPQVPDERFSARALIRLLVGEIPLPIIAAGGIMDGAAIAACLADGAAAVQLGTAFLACPESTADDDYRAALTSAAAEHTLMTAAISGRPARAVPNQLTAIVQSASEKIIPAYPITYDATKALGAAAAAQRAAGYKPYWAGMGAPKVRLLPARELVELLERELQSSLAESIPISPN